MSALPSWSFGVRTACHESCQIIPKGLLTSTSMLYPVLGHLFLHRACTRHKVMYSKETG